MIPRPGSRVRVTFAVLNAVTALILLVSVFGLVRPRYWVLDVPAGLMSAVQIVSAVGLFTRAAWALRALTVAAWASLVGGLGLVALTVLTMVFLRGVHGDDGLAATAISGLSVALLLPYTVLLPTLELLWLSGQSHEPEA